MKLLVSCLGYDSGKSGLSSYMRSVLKELRNFEDDITLVVEYDAVADFQEFKQVRVPKIFSKSFANYLWSIFVLPFIARKYDCVLVLAGNRRFVPFGKTAKVGVIHDLSQYRVSDKYCALRMFQLFKIQPILGRTFDEIVAISNSTKSDIAKYWKLDKNKIELNYNGVSARCEPDNNILKKLGLDKYVLYVSRIEHPAKNHANLISAFEKLPEQIRKNHKLVFVGADWNGADVIRKMAKESPDSDKIIFSGFVSNAELSALYKNARAFIFPSFAEGFGLGLAEAMLCDLPCACSNVSALAEVGGDASIQFNPHSVDEICSALTTLLSDEIQVARLIEKGRERVKLFSWEKHSEKLSALCRKQYAKCSSLKIFGVPFYNGRMNDIANILAEKAEKKSKTSVAFINTHYLNCAYENFSQRERLRQFDYVLPDGSGVSLACKILGYNYRDNLNGTDLLPYLCEVASKKNLSMYFLGGKEGVAFRASENLKKLYPNLKIAGTHNGYFDDDNVVVKEINDANVDFLFVGFGAIIQEKWVLENIDKLQCGVVLAVGGLCDVYSGDLKRNPIFRKLGLEWFGRLLQEPCRLFVRYVIGNPLFVLRVIKYRLFGKNSDYGKGA
ncbi:MAG: WecB/TagA/CpsF family glycosyltransferase [Opitutales bacterium]|nr:WecB/TagA/CpsF family glycosyltransferase [Opitutales bacterium]